MQFIDLKAQQNQIKEKIIKRIQNILDHGTSVPLIQNQKV